MSDFIENMKDGQIAEIKTEEAKEYIKRLRHAWCFMEVEVIGDYKAIKKVKYSSIKDPCLFYNCKHL